MGTSTETVKPSEGLDIVTTTDRALVASSNARVNIPLNLDNWKHLPPEVAEDLLWFHQHVLDEDLDLKAAGKAINYDGSTVYRILKGTYEGNWPNIIAAIASYKKIVAERAGIQRGKFAKNGVSNLIWAGLDYALANNSITLMVGESGLGKTIAAEAWRDSNNHGRTVMVEPPPIGGSRSILRVLCEAIGANKNMAQEQQLEAILRAFNPHRMLIVDEARRLLPAEARGDVNPVKLEIIRYIHDRTKCGVALIATQRFDDTLKKLRYQYEQVLGRVGQPVRLFRQIEERDLLPILQQYFRKPSERLKTTCMAVANDDAGGRLRTLCKLLEVASKFASNTHSRLAEEHFFKALALRRQMMGETQHSRK